jgi:hypothetical protein
MVSLQMVKGIYLSNFIKYFKLFDLLRGSRECTGDCKLNFDSTVMIIKSYLTDKVMETYEG